MAAQRKKIIAFQQAHMAILPWVQDQEASPTEQRNRVIAMHEILRAVTLEKRSLDLSGLELTSIPPHLLKLCPWVESVGLSHNKLQTLPNDFMEDMSRLTELALSYNCFSEIPACFLNPLPCLQFLNLSGNILSTLPEGFLSQAPHLEHLHLRHNHLIQLPENFLTESSRLVHLDLSHNRLICLPESITRVFQCPSNPIVHLEHNRFSIRTLETFFRTDSGYNPHPSVYVNTYDYLNPQPEDFIPLSTAVSLWVNGTELARHPLWNEMMEKDPQGSVAFAVFLKRLFQEIPRNSNGQPEPQLLTNIVQLLSSLAIKGADSEFTQKIITIARTATETCIDRVKLGYIQIQIACKQLIDPNNRSLKRLEQLVSHTIDSLGDIADCRLVYDPNTASWAPLACQFNDPESTMSLEETLSLALHQTNQSRQDQQLPPLEPLQLHDMTEDCLFLLQKFPEFTQEDIHMMDLTFLRCCTLKDHLQKTQALQDYILSKLPKEKPSVHHFNERPLRILVTPNQGTVANETVMTPSLLQETPYFPITVRSRRRFSFRGFIGC